jgi:hypothetical protein
MKNLYAYAAMFIEPHSPALVEGQESTRERARPAAADANRVHGRDRQDPTNRAGKEDVAGSPTRNPRSNAETMAWPGAWTRPSM